MNDNAVFPFDSVICEDTKTFFWCLSSSGKSSKHASQQELDAFSSPINPFSGKSFFTPPSDCDVVSAEPSCLGKGRLRRLLRFTGGSYRSDTVLGTRFRHTLPYDNVKCGKGAIYHAVHIPSLWRNTIPILRQVRLCTSFLTYAEVTTLMTVISADWELLWFTLMLGTVDLANWEVQKYTRPSL